MIAKLPLRPIQTLSNDKVVGPNAERLPNPTAGAYLSDMRKTAFLPCIPTRGTKVPSHPDWLHEVKHDGYRLIIQREGKRVRIPNEPAGCH